MTDRTEMKPIPETEADLAISTDRQLLELAEGLLRSQQQGTPAQSWLAGLAKLPVSAMQLLETEDHKKTFWINLYNAAVQHAVQQDGGKPLRRTHFFSTKRILVAGIALSLDDMEHVILRRRRLKWSLGFIRNPRTPSMLKGWQVHHVDPRIHFALNCGARSCPAVGVYFIERLQQQLDLASRSYIEQEASYDAKLNLLHVPRLMLWYYRDFGCRKGLLHWMRWAGVLPEDVKPHIRFNPYDWTLSLSHYQ